MSSTAPYSRSTITKTTSQAGLRKKVNVVSFNPGIDAQELVTKSPEKPCNTTSQPSNNPTRDLSCHGSGKQLFPVCIPPQTTTSDTISNSYSVLPKTITSSREHGVFLSKSARDQTPVNISKVTLSKVSNAVKSIHGKQTNREALASAESTIITRSSSRISTKTSQASVQYDSYLPLNVSDPTNISTSPLQITTAASSATNSCREIFTQPPLTHKTSQSVLQSSLPCRKVHSMAHSSSDDTKNQPRSFTSGSKRRATYNVRPWQNDIDCEDVSPNKTLRPNQTSNRIDAEAESSVDGRTRLSQPSSPAQGTGKSPAFYSGSRNPPISSSCTNHKDVGQFEFGADDCDGDFIVSTGPDRNKRRSAGSTHGLPTTTDGREKTKCNQQNTDNYDYEEDEEEEEDDDVKPMFCPSNRRVPATAVGELSLSKSKSFSHSRVERQEKPLFAVVRKVSDASVCQERGETQHLLDDVEYLIDGLADRNKVTTRTLSILTLANKCLTASFRHLIQSHGLVKRICDNLHDAYSEYSLALTSAGLFYVLTRGRHLSMLDEKSLATVLKLFSAPAGLPTACVGGSGSLGLSRAGGGGVGQNEVERIRLRVRQLIESLHQPRIGNSNVVATGTADVSAASQQKKQQLFPNASSSSSSNSCSTQLADGSCANMRHLQINRQLATSDLVMETILNLGTRKAPDWFKATLREGGGLDRIVDASIDAVDYLADLDPCQNNDKSNNSGGRKRRWWRPFGVRLDTFALERLKRVSHYTRLLENMTYMNSDNQTYLVNYRDRVLVHRLLRCIRVCSAHIRREPRPKASPTGVSNSLQPDQSVLVDCILGIFRLLVNISHNEFASDRLGGCPVLLETVFDCLLHLPHRMPSFKRFDLLVLTLCMLVNLCEHCPENRTRIVHMDLSVKVKPSRHRDPVGGESSDSGADDASSSSEGEEEEGSGNHRNGSVRSVAVTTALDELIQLFIRREEQARNHEFERDDGPSGDSPGEPSDPQGNHLSGSESTVANSNTGRQAATTLTAPQPSGHVEEAGLKWRLIEDRRDANFSGRGGRGNGRMLGRQGSFCGSGGDSGRKSHSRSRRRKRLTKNKAGGSSDEENSSDDDDDEEEDEEEEDFSEEDEDDDSAGSGADVEFVADTQEEQEKLAKHMSQAQQHMEDSVVAAHAALLLGCILQSSRRYADRIREKLPDGKFRPLAIMLAKLLSFLSLTKGVGSSGSESIRRIVRILQAQDDVEGSGDAKA